MQGAMAERKTKESTGAFVRSAHSIASETFWRSLRNGKPIPEREDFHPSHARPFLADLALLEVSFDEPLLRIRLAGTRVEARIQQTIGGDNYLDFLPEEFQAGALQSSRLMLSHPCGLWQFTNVHYERGTAQMMEQTAFPLGSRRTGTSQLLVLSNPTDAFHRPTLKAERAMLADTASKWEFLDLGYGVPGWPV
jgi:hypothetical protein